MSFLTGKTQNLPTSYFDPTSQGVRQRTAGELAGVDPLTGLNTSGPAIPPEFMQLFQSSLDPILAQAKESAGGLTGTGLSNTLGTAAGRSLSDFLLNMLSQRAGRATQLTQGFNQPLGQQPAYQPGFLDYLFQGAAAAAPFVAAA